MDENLTLELWKTITEFERRPYFSRVWIIQELGGGEGRTAVLCGRTRIDWKALSALAERLWTMCVAWGAPYKLGRRHESDHAIYSLGELATMFYSPYLQFPGYSNDMIFKHCPDARDRFFGTIDLVDGQRFGRTRPVPDHHVTPLELSVDLLTRTVRPSLKDALPISRSLGLQFSRQVLSDIEKERSSRGARCDKTRRYSFEFQGFHEIGRGADGKLNVDLDHKEDSRYAPSIPLYFDECKYDSNLLVIHDPALLFTGNKSSVLASACVRAGEICLCKATTVVFF